MSLEEAVTRSREHLLTGPMSEAAVSQGPVKRILSSLGWDVFDTAIVVPEFSVGPRRVDYALKSASSQVAVFLEVKAPGKGDGDADRQLFEYAFHEGVPLAVLTDGRTWSFYLPAGQGSYEDRRFLRLDIVERPIEEVCESLQRYLSCSRVRNGDAQNDARNDYNDKYRRARLRENIPIAWERLLREADEVLMDLLSDEVEEAIGQRPLASDVADFLSAQLVERTVGLDRKPTVAVEEIPASHGQAPNASNGLGFSIQNSVWKECKSGRQTYVELIKEFARRNPDFLERYAVAGKGRKRSWVSKDPDLLFPGRADLQAQAIEKLPNGWLLGLNISAEYEMPRRVEVACAVQGLVLGKDVLAKFK